MSAKWAKEHPDRIRELKRKWMKEHPDCNNSKWKATHKDKIREDNRNWRMSHKEYKAKHAKVYYLKKNYGMNEQDYQYMLDAQNGRCKACGRGPSAQKNGGLYVDHDHVTGRVRGLLCKQCNFAIGLARDDPVILRALATYLEEYE